MYPWFNEKKSKTEPKTYSAWKWILQKATSRRYKPNLFSKIRESDWDVLIILDACRYDVLSDVVENVVVESAFSPACVTQNFIKKAIRKNIFDGKTYVSANPNSKKLGQNINHIPVYESEWDNNINTVPPEKIYKRATNYVEKNKKTIVHTIQPHYPHICKIGDDIYPVPGGLHPKILDVTQEETPGQNIPYAFFSNKTNIAQAQQSYYSSTVFAWNSALKWMEKLINKGYSISVTADHGELLGEYGLFGHPWGVRLRPLVEVPWIEIQPNNQTIEQSISTEEKLESLGYL